MHRKGSSAASGRGGIAIGRAAFMRAQDGLIASMAAALDSLQLAAACCLAPAPLLPDPPTWDDARRRAEEPPAPKRDTIVLLTQRLLQFWPAKSNVRMP